MEKEKMVKVLKSPKQVKLLENPNYSRIISILRDGELTIKEIHKRFNKDYEDKKTLTSIYRYMEKLEKNDLVFVSKENLKRGHLIESYYSRTARFFLFADKLSNENVITAAIELLTEIYDLDEEKIKEVEKFLHEHNERLSEYYIHFYEKFGEKMLGVEKKYGFKTAKDAIYIIHQLLYFKKNTELLEQLFTLLKGNDTK
jgi:DNA-binding PadR family transcriptional regulator